MEGWAGATKSRAAMRERVAQLEQELARVKKEYKVKLGRRSRQLFRISAQHALLQKRRQDTMTRAMLAPKSKLQKQFAGMGVMQQQQTLGALMRSLRGGVRAVPLMKLMLALPRSQRLVLFHGVGCWLRVGDKAFKAALRADFDSSREMKARSRLLTESKTRSLSEANGPSGAAGAAHMAGDSVQSTGHAHGGGGKESDDAVPVDSSGEAALREKEEIAVMNIEYLMQLAQGTGTGRLDRIKQEASTGASGMEDAATGLRQLVASRFKPAAREVEPTHGGSLRQYTKGARDFAAESTPGSTEAGEVQSSKQRANSTAAQGVHNPTPEAAKEAFDLVSGSQHVHTPSDRGMGSGVLVKRKAAAGPYAKQGRRGSLDVLGILRAGTSAGDKIRQSSSSSTMPFVLRGLMLLDAASPLVDEARAVSGEMALRIKLADVLEDDDNSRLAWAHRQLSEHRDFLKAMELSRMAGQYDRSQARGALRLRPPATTKEEIARVLVMAGEADAAHDLRKAPQRGKGRTREARSQVEMDTVDDSLSGQQNARARALLQVKQRLRGLEKQLQESDKRKQKRRLGVASLEEDEMAVVERREYLSDESIVRDVVKVCADAGALRNDLQDEREKRRGLERRVLALGMRLAAVQSTLETQTKVAREQGLIDMWSLRRGRQLLLGRHPGSPGFRDGPGFVGLVLALLQRAENWGMAGGRLGPAAAGIRTPSTARQRELDDLYSSPEQIQRRTQAVSRAWLRSFRQGQSVVGGGSAGASGDRALSSSIRSLVGATIAGMRAESLQRLPLFGATGFAARLLWLKACSLPLADIARNYPMSTRGRTPSRSAARNRGFSFAADADSSIGINTPVASANAAAGQPSGNALEIITMGSTAAGSIAWSNHFEGERVQRHESTRGAHAAMLQLVAATQQLVQRAALEEAGLVQPNVLISNGTATPSSARLKSSKVVWKDQGGEN